MIDAAQAAPPAFISAEQISDYIAEGRAAEAAGQPWQTKPPFMRSVGAVGPFVLSIEYRNIPAPDYTIHQTEYELFVVLEGSGSMRIGGELKDPFRYRRTNLASKVIVGGEERKISKGDVLMISPKTAHGVSQSDGKLVLLALHMPPPAAPEK
ncbi:cupin domain-containing protein [Sphingobium boeckii]|uniref:Mannose-6-phosphate isomerase-like protein (Cupin superfamily) n=1 Tax=Sphingobium boeckii TaxID=1082345 RepID=A0A7W9AL88_9SPHN|nr:hypothetical protein [Sphingobium boeckii]MBB5687749.1 mannose-6-phosphate isomerase-like protein (cupin superfamily) [Sphingobium boeckii]